MLLWSCFTSTIVIIQSHHVISFPMMFPRLGRRQRGFRCRGFRGRGGSCCGVAWPGAAALPKTLCRGKYLIPFNPCATRPLIEWLYTYTDLHVQILWICNSHKFTKLNTRKLLQQGINLLATQCNDNVNNVGDVNYSSGIEV